MSVIKYQNEMDVGQEGLISSTQTKVIKTRAAIQDIEFGRGVVIGTEGGTNVKNIFKSKASLLFDADFVTGNTIDLKVNDVSITQVPFNTDHATTFADLIAAIDALDGVSAVAGVGREVIITIDDALSNITVSDVLVQGGASQAGSTITYSSVDVFEGISVLRFQTPSTIGGSDKYKNKDAVDVLTRGTIWVKAVATVAYGDAVYVYNDKANPTNQGQFTNASSGNLLVPTGKFLGSVAGTIGTPALVEIEINLP